MDVSTAGTVLGLIVLGAIIAVLVWPKVLILGHACCSPKSSVRCVCVDMPGHEGTSRIKGDNYSIQGQVTLIHQFVKSIGLDKRLFHLVGTSMGGSVAGVYATDYLSSVTLICPEMTDEKPTMPRKKSKTNVIPTTPVEFKRLMKQFCYNERKVPSLIIRGILDIKSPNVMFYQEELVKAQSIHLLQNKMHLITVPLQMI